ncbi:MAG: murein transglycosylase [Synechococcaceae cyanobacterium RL_1_2]|nr:murein transglycosylase [Synechococcaceae cyanobacterium RL_1_2]
MGKLMFMVALWAASFGLVPFKAQAQSTNAEVLTVVPAPTEILPDLRLGDRAFPGDLAELLISIDHSLDYIDTPSATRAYQNYPIPSITQERVKRSLLRFRELAATAPDPTSLQTSLAAEFDFYQAAGQDGLGTVKFTGYYEPIYQGSRVKTSEFKYPIYRTPWNLKRWGNNQPRRVDIEGTDGISGSRGPAKGYELAWLSNRLDAYLLQVQGSGRIEFADGSMMSVGYDADNGYDYTSLGKALVEDGVIAADKISMPAIMEYFDEYPDAMDSYLPRNDRFIFFGKLTAYPPWVVSVIP